MRNATARIHQPERNPMHAPYPPETLARIARALERIADAIAPEPADPAPNTASPAAPSSARMPAAPGVAGLLSNRPFGNSRYRRGQ